MKSTHDIDFAGHTCLLCGRECDGRRSLGNHLQRAHGTQIKRYIFEEMKVEPPACACGCRAPVEWHASQFRFSRFVSGHNRRTDDGSGMRKGHRLPDEVVERRNDAIKKAYVERGPEIREKITRSLVKKYSTLEARQVLSEAGTRRWSSPEERRRQSVRSSATWAIRGDELRARIFTPEFSRKISEANMRRPYAPSSGELRFMDALETNGLTVKRDKQVFFSEIGRGKRFDGTCDGAMIEYDGVLWHVRELPDDGLYVRQMHNVAGDLEKYFVCKERGIELIRVWEDADPTDMTSMDDLRAAAHLVLNGPGGLTVGSPRKLADDYIILPRSRLLADRRDKGPEFIRTEVVPGALRLLRAHTLVHGWFYPSVVPDDLSGDLRALRTRLAPTSADIRPTATGGRSLRARFRSFWHAGKGGGIVGASLDDTKLERAVSYRCGLGPSKDYTYTLADGSSVIGFECFDVSLAEIRKGLGMGHHGVSWFHPNVIVDAMARLRMPAGSTVWDPSGGFGARMLGACAYDPMCTYICNDPAEMTNADLQMLSFELMDLEPRFYADVRRGGSETADVPDGGSCDLVFTSPPYFDLERYFDEPGQCWRDFPDESSWYQGYVLPTMRNAFKVLKRGGRCAMNVNAKCSSAFIAAGAEAGLVRTEADDMRLLLGRDHMTRAKGFTDVRQEPIITWRRP